MTDQITALRDLIHDISLTENDLRVNVFHKALCPLWTVSSCQHEDQWLVSLRLLANGPMVEAMAPGKALAHALCIQAVALKQYLEYPK